MFIRLCFWWSSFDCVRLGNIEQIYFGQILRPEARRHENSIMDSSKAEFTIKLNCSFANVYVLIMAIFKL